MYSNLALGFGNLPSVCNELLSYHRRKSTDTIASGHRRFPRVITIVYDLVHYRTK
jgi:hypothetical protein